MNLPEFLQRLLFSSKLPPIQNIHFSTLSTGWKASNRCMQNILMLDETGGANGCAFLPRNVAA